MRTVEEVEKEIELLKDKVDKLQDQLIDGEIDVETFSVEVQKLISIKRTLRWVIEDLPYYWLRRSKIRLLLIFRSE